MKIFLIHLFLIKKDHYLEVILVFIMKLSLLGIILLKLPI